MTMSHEQLPRIFQANLARLYDRVIRPGLEALVVHSALETGAAVTLDQLLDRAAAQVDNYTANEAAKAYVLTLAAVFERQLSIWSRSIQHAPPAKTSRARGFEDLLSVCAQYAGIDLEQNGLRVDVIQMFTVANVVRHGEGRSCEKLRIDAPELWETNALDYYDVLPGAPQPSEQLRVRNNDLVRYISATTRFWGLADAQPGAVIDPPYHIRAVSGLIG